MFVGKNPYVWLVKNMQHCNIPKAVLVPSLFWTKTSLVNWNKGKTPVTPTWIASDSEKRGNHRSIHGGLSVDFPWIFLQFAIAMFAMFLQCEAPEIDS